MATKKFRVIYIAGTGHCSSTILDMLLGSSKITQSLGELSFYNVYKEANTNCTCGQSFDNCPFWSKITGNYRIKRKYSIKDYLMILLSISFFGNKKLLSIKDETDKLLSELLSTGNKKTKYFVDSSKDPRRLAYLLNNPNLEIIPIHLIRESHGVAASYSKKTGARIDQKPKNFYTNHLKWAIVNLAITLLTRNNSNLITVHYKKFCQKTEKYIKMFNKKLNLGIDVKRYIENIDKTGYHNIDGNLRVKRNGIKKISYREKWKDNLNLPEKVFSKTVSKLLNTIWKVK